MSDEPIAGSRTRWRDKAYQPDNYDDIDALVKLARAARRDRIVEFDWYFSEDDIRRLQRAVFGWGSTTVGRYQSFDARVLAAIRDALGEPLSGFVLNEPKRGGTIDAAVTCAPDGTGWRLTGHAPFDIVFGYASGTFPNNPWRLHLGESVARTLEQTAADLGWDLRRLQEDRLRPARNVLFGFPPSYGINKDDRSMEPTGPVEEVSVHFQGPYSAFPGDDCPCLFTEPIAVKSGVYLWTFRHEAEHRVWYVGQTIVGFGQRTGQHIASYLSGQYATYDLALLHRGVLRSVNPTQAGSSWPETLPQFLENAERALPKILAFIKTVRFHVAVLPKKPPLLNRVEGAIGRYFKQHPDAACRDFFLVGIKVPGLIPYDRRFRFLLSSEAAIAGMPTEVLE